MSVTPMISAKKSTDTVLMALARKGLTFGGNQRINCMIGVFY
ncbi:unnamed protein product [Staurois parvus]|uniref:Uncharacterized protein n=1 Tax=Staurois parvus TaxID=386267 RepID=A0ABN9DJU3_9NEOB|nr:unnamed protein product [Staurois parvus]